MANAAVAREIVFALRRQIARIEGTLPERLEQPAEPIRRGGASGCKSLWETGVERFDAALGGGVPKAALIELYGKETRDAGALGGFALALAGRLSGAGRGSAAAPLLWIGTAEIFRETGFPHACGLRAAFGIEPQALLFCEAGKLADALWIAGEAIRLETPVAVVLEVRGNPRGLDLTASRRLHMRARDCGRPLLLLRHGAVAEPSAAPLRLIVGAAPSALRETIGGPLAGSIGRPAFTVAIDKGGHAASRHFTLEWNPDEHIFEERRPESRSKNSFPVVSLPRTGANPAAAPGAVLAFRQGAGPHAPGGEPPRWEQPLHRRPRRTG